LDTWGSAGHGKGLSRLMMGSSACKVGQQRVWSRARTTRPREQWCGLGVLGPHLVQQLRQHTAWSGRTTSGRPHSPHLSDVMWVHAKVQEQGWGLHAGTYPPTKCRCQSRTCRHCTGAAPGLWGPCAHAARYQGSVTGKLLGLSLPSSLIEAPATFTISVTLKPGGGGRRNGFAIKHPPIPPRHHVFGGHALEALGGGAPGEHRHGPGGVRWVEPDQDMSRDRHNDACLVRTQRQRWSQRRPPRRPLRQLPHQLPQRQRRRRPRPRAGRGGGRQRRPRPHPPGLEPTQSRTASGRLPLYQGVHGNGNELRLGF
jgi:hypothetical protein